MSFNQITLLLCTIACISIGQILLKFATVDMKNIDIYSIFQPKLILAISVYVIATVFWIALLRDTPLKIAYPFMGLSFVIVPILSWLFLDEQLGLNSIGGGLVILIGIWIAIS